jgi:transcriptional regulator with XRE-family HTH domain
MCDIISLGEAITVKLRELRETHNETQMELGKALNISPSTIGMYEQGRRYPSLDVLRKIADHYNVTTDYLLGRRTAAEDITTMLMQPSDDKPSPIKQMLDLYHTLTPEKKKQARSYIPFLAQDNNMV